MEKQNFPKMRNGPEEPRKAKSDWCHEEASHQGEQEKGDKGKGMSESARYKALPYSQSPAII